ncbi:class I SAM-dependent DNA methyltransferase [Neobacillus terrae]|uniref:class I SAM-dependent DNA methyltransferase n=1 Tax=Neobacillus terrae TaxID=3034837 RepID=UPI00140CFABF|nr:class I SAM-dependent methyltransferase [Neobacillus terrae]NHM30789.1 class I SAM-dependent methyltransferase [Neobacillus terrae]
MGREFLDVFEEWADSYDASVLGQDEEYKEVFKKYDKILEEVALRSRGNVVEFGVGTGNITVKLLEKGHKVTGIEPSKPMRKIAKEKLGRHAEVMDGDFLVFPELNNVMSIVSSYAFHHLTDVEKEEAISLYGKLLPKEGKIVFADTMYESEKDYLKAINNAKEKGFHNLASNLQSEYYSTIPILKGMMEKNGFLVSFFRCNDFVWIMEGVKL